MIQQNEETGMDRISAAFLSRRSVLGSSALALLGLLARSAFCQADGNAQDARERAERARAAREEKRANGATEDRMKFFTEFRTAARQRLIAGLKEQLGVPDKEWAVIEPRIETIYDLMHPMSQPPGSTAEPASELERARADLRKLLQNKETPADQIKAKLTALRAAVEKTNQQLAKARQELRKILTPRQEALLVLNGMLI